MYESCAEDPLGSFIRWVTPLLDQNIGRRPPDDYLLYLPARFVSSDNELCTGPPRASNNRSSAWAYKVQAIYRSASLILLPTPRLVSWLTSSKENSSALLIVAQRTIQHSAYDVIQYWLPFFICRSVRFIVFDKYANIIAQHQAEFPQYYPEPGYASISILEWGLLIACFSWHEHDADEIQQVSELCIAEASRKLEKTGWAKESIKIIGASACLVVICILSNSLFRRHYKPARDCSCLEP